jgi:hypothetical protein
MSRRNLKDPRTPEQRRRAAIAARNRARQELHDKYGLPLTIMTADKAHFCPVGGA